MLERSVVNKIEENMTTTKSSSKDTSIVDARIGAKINELRLALGTTRQDLAGQIGVTHQQLQKYERGVNRITVSRLIDISKCLDVPIDTFIEAAQQGNQVKGNDFKQRMCMEVMRDFIKITRDDQQDAVRKLVKALANES
jgi:transcriptional regulator with XRE-family HTH domain